jgi:aspartyl protease family protein
LTVVGTGATMASMSVDDERRAGVNYRKGARGCSQTANGVVGVYQVKLDTVKVGDIALSNVDGVVHESSLPGCFWAGASSASSSCPTKATVSP